MNPQHCIDCFCFDWKHGWCAMGGGALPWDKACDFYISAESEEGDDEE